MVNMCEMTDSIKVVEFIDIQNPSKNTETYCDFKIEENALVFTDKTISVINYTSIEIANFTECKKLYPQMHPDNFMVFVELWKWNDNKTKANLAKFYFEGTKDKCFEKYELFNKYKKQESTERLIVTDFRNR